METKNIEFNGRTLSRGIPSQSIPSTADTITIGHIRTPIRHLSKFQDVSKTTHTSLKMPINDIVKNSAVSINQINSFSSRPVIMESDDRSDFLFLIPQHNRSCHHGI